MQDGRQARPACPSGSHRPFPASHKRPGAWNTAMAIKTEDKPLDAATPEADVRGVFRSLYNAVAVQARIAGAIGLCLYVERDNTRAQRTHVSLGMEHSRYHMYEALFA